MWNHSERQPLYIGRNTLRSGVLELLFPRRCPVCHDIVAPRGEKICAACRGKIRRVAEPTCRRCGKPVMAWEVEYCYDCTKHHRSFAGGVSLMAYDAVGRSTMTAFKYKGRQEYAAFYGEELWRTYGRRIREFDPDVIIPVPVHISRRRYRGYNQAEVLGKELSRYSGIPMATGSLVRTRRTEAQKNLNAEERCRNMERALEVRGDLDGIRRVLLVDDIYTTGSTLEACTRVLLRNGVQSVFVVTVCIGSNQ